METTYLILLILLLLYIPFYFYVRAGKLSHRGIVKYGPTVMFKTSRGVHYLDKIAKYKRFWRVFGTISKVMALFLMIMIIMILVLNLTVMPLMMNSPGIGVEYALAIPGLNPIIPLFYGVIGLVVAVAVHEIAHGIQTRANDMDVESTGLLYAVVPIGAFVEPNNDQIEKCGRKARSSMFAAGIAVNLTLAIVLFLVMSVGMMGTMSSDQYGERAAVTNVTSGSPADDSGIGFSSVILKINDVPMTTYDELMDYSFELGVPYAVSYGTRDGPLTATGVYLGVYVSGVASGSPIYEAGITSGNFFIKEIEGREITSFNSFAEIMKDYHPTEVIEIKYVEYANGALGAEGKEYITLGDNNGRPYIGIYYSLSGFSFTTPDAVLEAMRNPLHDVDSITDAAYAAIMYIGLPMRGYSPLPAEMTWWYDSSLMSDDVFWVVLQIIFWIFWLNLLLGVTNALPAIPFDGGYLFRDGVGAIVDRTHKNSTPEKREAITNGITKVMSYFMLMILLLIMVAVLF